MRCHKYWRVADCVCPTARGDDITGSKVLQQYSEMRGRAHSLAGWASATMAKSPGALLTCSPWAPRQANALLQRPALKVQMKEALRNIVPLARGSGLCLALAPCPELLVTHILIGEGFASNEIATRILRGTTPARSQRVCPGPHPGRRVVYHCMNCRCLFCPRH